MARQSTTASGPNRRTSSATDANSDRATWRCRHGARSAGSVSPRCTTSTSSPRATRSATIRRPMNRVPPSTTTRTLRLDHPAAGGVKDFCPWQNAGERGSPDSRRNRVAYWHSHSGRIVPMLVAEHIAVLKREGEHLADAIGRADPDQPVPTCPEWTVRELAHHMGRVHRWAAAVVRDAWPDQPTSEDEERIWGTMPADDALEAWVREGHRQIVDALTSAPADLSCWTFLAAPSPLAFWARRQAHETAIHRVDAQTVLGEPGEVEAAFATDGLDELLLCFFAGRSRRLRNDKPVTLG